jgi:hypothetical protein
MTIASFPKESAAVEVEGLKEKRRWCQDPEMPPPLASMETTSAWCGDGAGVERIEK